MMRKQKNLQKTNKEKTFAELKRSNLELLVGILHIFVYNYNSQNIGNYIYFEKNDMEIR